MIMTEKIFLDKLTLYGVKHTLFLIKRVAHLFLLQIAS